MERYHTFDHINSRIETLNHEIIIKNQTLDKMLLQTCT